MSGVAQLLKRDSRRLSQTTKRSKSKSDRLQRLPFVILLLGKSGLGMSTFCDMFMAKATDISVKYFCIQENGLESLCTPTEAESALTSFLFYREVIGELETETGKQKFVVLDVRGLEENTSSQFVHFESVLNMIKQRLTKYLELSDIEYMVRLGKPSLDHTERRKVPDARIHCCLYFLEPTTTAPHARDFENLRELQMVVNVIPVIGRSDMLTEEEKLVLKGNTNAILRDEGLVLYFNSIPDAIADNESDAAFVEIFKTTASKMPFALINSSQLVKDGNIGFGRNNTWGIVMAENPNHSDVTDLQRSLLVTHLDDLRLRTTEVLYESFRAEKLSQLKPVPST